MKEFRIWRYSRHFFVSLFIMLIQIVVITIFALQTYHFDLGTVFITNSESRNLILYNWEPIIVFTGILFMFLNTSSMQIWEQSATSKEYKYSKLVYFICLLLCFLPILGSYLYGTWLNQDSWVWHNGQVLAMISPFDKYYMPQLSINIAIYVSLAAILLKFLSNRIIATLIPIALYVLSIATQSQLIELSLRDPYFGSSPNLFSIVIAFVLVILASFLYLRKGLINR